MSTGAWSAVAGLLALVGIAATVLGGVITARGTRRASPYDALERRVVWLEEQHAENTAKLEAQRGELVDLREGRSNDQTEIIGLKRRVAGMYEDRDDLVRYITVLRAWIANGAKPPAPAVPTHLADVLPAWVPGDGAEPPPRTERP